MIGKITLEQVRSRSRQILFGQIIDDHHSYMHHEARVGGRKIDFIIFQTINGRKNLLGLLGLNLVFIIVLQGIQFVD